MLDPAGQGLLGSMHHEAHDQVGGQGGEEATRAEPGGEEATRAELVRQGRQLLEVLRALGESETLSKSERDAQVAMICNDA
jgi:hypothetical protein